MISNACRVLSRDSLYRRRLRGTATMSAVLLIAWLLMGAMRSAAEPDSRVDASQAMSVRFHKGILSVHSLRKPWEQVLKAIQDKTGTHFHHTLPLREPVSVSIAGLPIEQALIRLFGPEASFIFQYPGGISGAPAAPRDVWVLGPVFKDFRDATKQPAGPRARASLASADQESPAKRPEADGGPIDSTLPDAELIDYLTTMSRDPDPATRAQAISALVQFGKEEEAGIQFALDAALYDEDAMVRGAALQALAGSGAQEAIGPLRQALRDPNPDVWTLAVESVPPGSRGRALLEEALSDTEETVRVIAWERLRQEGELRLTTTQ